MARIATAAEATVWRCDAMACGGLAETPTAFEVPPGWWQVSIQRRTAIDEDGRGGKRKIGQIDACSKACLIDAIQFDNQSLVPYVDAD